MPYAALRLSPSTSQTGALAEAGAADAACTSDAKHSSSPQIRKRLNMISSSAVRAVGVSKQVSSGGQPLSILDGVDLAVAAGESLANVGSLGSAPPTFSSLPAGPSQPTTTEVERTRNPR